MDAHKIRSMISPSPLDAEKTTRLRDKIRAAIHAVVPEDPATSRRLSATTSLSQRTGNAWGNKHVYGGTVTAKTKRQRRAQNKRAKLSRKANR